VVSAGSDEDDVEHDHEEGNDDDRDASPDQHEWGDNAVIMWEAGSNRDEDASSVDPREAGILEDEDDWGGDALLAWDEDDIDDDNGDLDIDEYGRTLVIGDDLDEETTDGEVIDETEEALVARGMPMYRDWQVKELQVSVSVPMHREMCLRAEIVQRVRISSDCQA
jgi:hypothetical protein